MGTTSPRDMFVNIVARAIRTGTKNAETNEHKDRFYIGRVTGMVVSASVIAHMAYGCDPDAARQRIQRLVQDVRHTWSREDRMDTAKVAEEAEVILGQVLLVEAAS